MPKVQKAKKNDEIKRAECNIWPKIEMPNNTKDRF